ncbi:cytochrome c [Methylibium sp.]|uniref:cytochrome c n=1 Tax=Methylibium sp. TaxID=2067992 RepID=UPI0025DBBB07|nr:cytochrome c [Methylibium sp.]
MKFYHLAFMLACALCGPQAAAQKGTDIFEGADLALGERLIEEHRCAQCHTKTVGGDGSAIYRPKGRINTPGFLRGMVEQCNTQMNLGLFPEEVTAIAAVLDRDHYRFKPAN